MFQVQRKLVQINGGQNDKTLETTAMQMCRLEKKKSMSWGLKRRFARLDLKFINSHSVACDDQNL